MRIGVSISNFHPDAGGGFTFQDEVFRAFCKVSAQSPHRFIVLGPRAGVDRYLDLISATSNMKAVPTMTTFLDRCRQSLCVYSPLFRKIIGNAGPVERSARKLGLDCIWFVAGGVHAATDTPYIATVWDLQHRITPWFPEMSTDGVWDSRELSYRYFLQRASYIITGTQAGRDEINQSYAVPAERIRLLAHPTPQFALKADGPVQTGILARLGLSEDYLLYPAQFWAHKNHINLLIALKELQIRHGLHLTLVLAGSDKGNHKYIKKTAADFGLSRQVFFTGYITQQELIELYQNAAMLVYASFFGPENLPPLEAFALECPVVAADVPGATEQLQDAAILFKPTNPKDIAEKIRVVYSDANLRKKMQDRGLKRSRAWTALDFSKGMLDLFNDFSAVRRCWP